MNAEEIERTPPVVSDVAPRKAFTARRAVKAILIVFGCANVAVGVVGIVIPGLPTTIFLIMALWAFSQSSDRFHKWLYNHRLFGPALQNWTAHGIIPRKAKALAVITMSISWCAIAYYSEYWIWPLVVGILMIVVASYILTRSSSREITNPCNQIVP